MRKTTLVVMAAGIGSRFGGGIKQLEAVGPSGEIIMDYSVHDAIKAGFNKIVFIIRRDIENDFREIIGNRMENLCKALGVEVCYAFQSLDNVPDGITVPDGRTKPWGTGQAVLSCKGIVNEPFAVINADDYYGKEAFVKLHDFLLEYSPEKPKNCCMAGFILKNTLSDNGGVTRGVCSVDENGYLTDVEETSNIIKTKDGVFADSRQINPDSYVSMNMWGLTPEFMEVLEKGFEEFFDTIDGNELKAEYLIPIYIGKLLRRSEISVKVLETADKWFGVTYKEDKPTVVKAFKQLIAAGEYKESLFSDLT